MFIPRCLPILIGSLPLSDHREAAELIVSCTPEIPLWPQLPKHKREGMIRQFLDGFPGLVDRNEAGAAQARFWVDTGGQNFTLQMATFYEHYLQALELPVLPDESPFALNPQSAPGFFALRQLLESGTIQPRALKGQITGPITTGIGLKDQSGASVLYDDTLRDIIVKLLSLRARWQVEQLGKLCSHGAPIIFIDEPGIVSFGSTAYAGVTRELVTTTVSEIIASIQLAGGMAGIHICANGDWEPALVSAAEIISFDAYSFFDNLVLYQDQLTAFLERGGILAWGIIPTGDPEIIARERVEALYLKWQQQLEILCSLGFGHLQILEQTLIAPACGTGSLSPELAGKVLSMTRHLADIIRRDYGLEQLEP
jgi:methionine synthase II (cobalamin-independent)